MRNFFHSPLAVWIFGACTAAAALGCDDAASGMDVPTLRTGGAAQRPMQQALTMEPPAANTVSDFCGALPACITSGHAQLPTKQECVEFMPEVFTAFKACAEASTVAARYAALLSCVQRTGCAAIAATEPVAQCADEDAAYHAAKMAGGPQCIEIDD